MLDWRRRAATAVAPGLVVAAAAVGTGLGYTGLPWWAVVAGAGWLTALTLAVQSLLDAQPAQRDRRYQIVIGLMAVALVAAPVYHYAYDGAVDTDRVVTFRYTVDTDGPTAQAQFGGDAVWRYSAPDLTTPNPAPVLAGEPVDLLCITTIDEITWGKVITGRDWIPLVDLKPEVPEQAPPPPCP